ncbi:MAG TPA: STAS domain-containing protein [Candidatus Brocadiia bacterium]|nr:STAS domain-containing protein [Candidatus Brocadiia bacterium]
MELKTIRADDQLSHVALVGRLDAEGVQEVDLQFVAATASRKKPAVVDMSKVDFVASLGMRMLAGCVRSLLTSGCKVALLNPQPLVLEAITNAGLLGFLHVEKDLDAAVQYVTSR